MPLDRPGRDGWYKGSVFSGAIGISHPPATTGITIVSMQVTPEQLAREQIDALLEAGRWVLQNSADFNRNASEWLRAVP